MNPLTTDLAPLIILLIAAHAAADYPLQGDFLARGKDRHTDIGKIFWPHCLTAHAMIHGGFVTLITGSASLGAAEAVAHWVTDWLKCEKKISLHTDQAIHIVCKLVWAAAVVISKGV